MLVFLISNVKMSSRDEVLLSVTSLNLILIRLELEPMVSQPFPKTCLYERARAVQLTKRYT